MNDRDRVALTQIRENRAISVRRISRSQMIFKIVEGHNNWYVIYNNKNHGIDGELSEKEARFQVGDPVTWWDGAKYCRGIVAVIIPPCGRLLTKLDTIAKAGYNVDQLRTELNITRKNGLQTSYLVSVNKVLYWPLISTLRKATVENAR